MTAGAIFGVGPGTAVVSVAATLAATGAFLIARCAWWLGDVRCSAAASVWRRAGGLDTGTRVTLARCCTAVCRHVARDRVLQYAASHPKFAAIDKAIGRDSLRVVFLLRLSPLLPLAASNYLFGVTSLDLRSYVIGSWLGMLPGTYAYVAAGGLILAGVRWSGHAKEERRARRALGLHPGGRGHRRGARRARAFFVFVLPVYPPNQAHRVPPPCSAQAHLDASCWKAGSKGLAGR